jgi:hypothetical protein
LKLTRRTARPIGEAVKGAIAEATALREKEATEFAKVSGDLQTNIDALAKAIPAIEKGMGSDFLQTTAMSNVDRQMLASSLSSKTGYAPASGEIVGILKTMQDEMVQNLADTKAAEESAIAAFEDLKGKAQGHRRPLQVHRGEDDAHWRDCRQGCRDARGHEGGSRGEQEIYCSAAPTMRTLCAAFAATARAGHSGDLHLKEDAHDYLSEDKLKDTAKKYYSVRYLCEDQEGGRRRC